LTNAALAALLAPALLAWAAIAILERTRWSQRLADLPNERSLHARPTPRIGGLGVLAGSLSIAAPHAAGPLAVVLACALALALISLVDDLRGLPVAVRLAAHGAAAALAMLAIAGTPEDSAAWLAWLIAALAIAWSTNLFNFMDGSDGLAGGMALLGFGAYGIAAHGGGYTHLALVSLALASASAGFLLHNFPPARVFLGDAGSIPLGFLAGALGVHGIAIGAWPLAFPLLAFSPFLVDATLTLLMRAMRGEPVWQAHRSHHYQQLVLAGWSRRRLALAAYALMLAAAASALVLAAAGPMVQCGIISVWAAVYALLFLAIRRTTNRAAGTVR
jgi:UDP-GlcNAc:undecaprenyl-phosphate GlcNAc-1-phosphate transferase